MANCAYEGDLKNDTTSFFQRLRKFGRTLDSEYKQLEDLLAANKLTTDKDLLTSDAHSVLQKVAGEIEDTKFKCKTVLDQLQDDCTTLDEGMDQMRSLLGKQEELVTFYSDELSKYGYTNIESNKENIPQGENSDDHIKSGLTSVAYFEKNSLPGDFHHNGLLVTPGLFTSEDKGTHFCSPNLEPPNDGTFLIEKVELLSEPVILSNMDLCSMKLPEEPVLLSLQMRNIHGSRKVTDNQYRQKFDPTDPMTPLPPEPVLRSQSVNRNISHGIKKINLDDVDSDEELGESTGSEINPAPSVTLTTAPIHLTKTPNKFVCGMQMPDTPELMTVKFYPSAKLLATIRQTHEAETSESELIEAADAGDTTLTEADNDTVGNNIDIKMKQKYLESIAVKEKIRLPTPPVVHEQIHPGPAPLADPKSVSCTSAIQIPSSPRPVSKLMIDHREHEGQCTSSETEPRFHIRLVDTPEYDQLPDSLRGVVSVHRMNRCVESINEYLLHKTKPVLSLSEIRDDMGFGRHAKDVIVFLLKLRRIDIHKRCSKNPSYSLRSV